ncbi:MAG: 6-phospho-3-hexuloisomerase [Candidatus Thermoplasmatota archaeon]|jgi:6-phospho-3-hexuloisomerase
MAVAHGPTDLRGTVDYIAAVARKTLDIDQATLQSFLNVLQPARRVFLYGRGRSGFVARAFAVRLMHLGYQTYVVGETITAPVARQDVVILVSGSGLTYPVVMTAELGRRQGATVVAITAQPDSEVARLAHVVVPLVPPTGNGERAKLAPLGTLFETSAWLFFDAVVAQLMQRLGESEDSMRNRHATLE